MMEAHNAVVAGEIKKIQCAENVCFHKHVRTRDGIIDMTLCRKMDYVRGPILFKYSAESFSIANICLHKNIILFTLNLEILLVGGVCKRIQINKAVAGI